MPHIFSIIFLASVLREVASPKYAHRLLNKWDRISGIPPNIYEFHNFIFANISIIFLTSVFRQEASPKYAHPLLNKWGEKKWKYA